VPTQQVLTVGDYRCTLLALAKAEIQNDGFTVGSISEPNDDASIVVAQDPAPGSQQAPLTPINLTVVAAPAETCPT
jgi:beta-lactam-binding protein with PASTA domain